MQHLHRSLAWILLVLFPLLVMAQTEDRGISLTTELSQRLQSRGFQNILVNVDQARKLNISFENRRYRFDAKSFQVAMEDIQTITGDQFSTINLTLVKRAIPITTFTFSSELSGQQGAGNFHFSDQSRRGIDDEKYTASGQYKILFKLEPELRLALGGFPDAVVHQVNLLPSANIFLWKGAKVTLQATIPIANEFAIPEEEFLRPRVMVFNQIFRLPENIFISTDIGYFTRDRYGINAEAGKFFFNGDLFIRAKVGYTGYAAYPAKRTTPEPTRNWERGKINYFDYLVGVDYYLGAADIQLTLEYGRVLYFRNMARFEVNRYFNEIDIGFFAYLTQGEENYGFSLSIPIFPKKYHKPKVISFQPERYFQYGYSGTQNYAIQYSTGTSLKQFFQRLQPFFLDTFNPLETNNF